jgi:hypothetical protein
MGIDQHDAALGTISQRAALHRLGTAWRLENDNLRRRSAMIG